jgi:hypothetical protein
MKKTTFALLIILGLNMSAHAAIVTFDDKLVFLSATGATSATGALPDFGLIPGGAGASETVGGVTFSIAPPSSELYIGTAGQTGIVNNDWTTRLTGADIAISDVENLNVELTISVFSLGFDFVEPEDDPNVNEPFIDSTFGVSLFDGGSLVDSFTFNAANDIAAFVGVWGDTPFNRVEIREIDGGIDNEFFGQIYTGTTPVPIPSTLFLLSSGFTGIFLIRRKLKVDKKKGTGTH